MSHPLTKFDSSYGGIICQAPSTCSSSSSRSPQSAFLWSPSPWSPPLPQPKSTSAVNVFFLPGASLKFSQFSVKASLHLQRRQERKFLPATKAPLALPRQLAMLASLDCSTALQLNAYSTARLLSSSTPTRLLACSPARQLLQLACYHGYTRLQ